MFDAKKGKINFSPENPHATAETSGHNSKPQIITRTNGRIKEGHTCTHTISNEQRKQCERGEYCVGGITGRVTIEVCVWGGGAPSPSRCPPVPLLTVKKMRTTTLKN